MHEYTLFYSKDRIPGMGIMGKRAFQHLKEGFHSREYSDLWDFNSDKGLGAIEGMMLADLQKIGEYATVVERSRFNPRNARQDYDYVIRLQSGVLLYLPSIENGIEGIDEYSVSLKKAEAYHKRFMAFMHHIIGEELPNNLLARLHLA